MSSSTSGFGPTATPTLDGGFSPDGKRPWPRMVIFTRDPNELDRYADLVLNDEIGPVLGDVAGMS